MENLNRCIAIKEIAIVFENLLIKKSMESVSSVENSTKQCRRKQQSFTNISENSGGENNRPHAKTIV